MPYAIHLGARFTDTGLREQRYLVMSEGGHVIESPHGVRWAVFENRELKNKELGDNKMMALPNQRYWVGRDYVWAGQDAQSDIPVWPFSVSLHRKRNTIRLAVAGIPVLTIGEQSVSWFHEQTDIFCTFHPWPNELRWMIKTVLRYLSPYLLQPLSMCAGVVVRKEAQYLYLSSLPGTSRLSNMWPVLWSPDGDNDPSYCRLSSMFALSYMEDLAKWIKDMPMNELHHVLWGKCYQYTPPYKSKLMEERYCE